MKKQKATYLPFFFLLCFVISFCLGSLVSNPFGENKSTPIPNKSVSVSKKSNSTTNDNETLFEENENETESETILSPIVISFFTFFFHKEFSSKKIFSFAPLSQSTSNPIYLSVCNFRI